MGSRLAKCNKYATLKMTSFDCIFDRHFCCFLSPLDAHTHTQNHVNQRPTHFAFGIQVGLMKGMPYIVACFAPTFRCFLYLFFHLSIVMHGEKNWNLVIQFTENVAFREKKFASLRENLSFRWTFWSFSYKNV